MPTYKIIRGYQSDHYRSETVATGLTLEEAQAHCKDPETSSRTATGRKAKLLTDRCGPWFDGYEEE
mgnify:CR=1 FL=1